MLGDFFKVHVKKRIFWMPLVALALMAYGFSITNRTVGIDDLRAEMYFHSGHVFLASRWGFLVWGLLLGRIDADVFIPKFYMMVFLMVTAILLASELWDIELKCNKKIEKPIAYTLFCCFIVTYPIIGEAWEYNLYELTGNMMLAAIVIRIISNDLYGFTGKIVSCILMTIVLSSYEAGGFFYVTMVFVLLLHRYYIFSSDGLSINQFTRKSFDYFFPCIVGVMSRYIISLLLRNIFNLQSLSTANGHSTIEWFSPGFSLKNLIKGMIQKYYIAGCIYFPVSVFVICSLFFLLFLIIYSIKKKMPSCLFVGLLAYFSSFALSAIQGDVMPYRTAQTLTAISAYTLYLLITCVKRKALNNIIVVSAGILVLEQAVFLNRELMLNNLRSQNEMAIAYQLGYDLTSNYPDKPLLFVGEYSLGDYINNRIGYDRSSIGGRLYEKISIAPMNKIPESNINSVLNWNNVSKGFEEYFDYLGFDFDVIYNADMKIEAEEIAREEKMRRYSVYETDVYLIVTLSDYS